VDQARFKIYLVSAGLARSVDLVAVAVRAALGEPIRVRPGGGQTFLAVLQAAWCLVACVRWTWIFWRSGLGRGMGCCVLDECLLRLVDTVARSGGDVRVDGARLRVRAATAPVPSW
jgi:hypothetical protein